MNDSGKQKGLTGVGATGEAAKDTKLNQCGTIDANQVSTQAASAFAAAVLQRGGEVHRLPDGKGGVFQISVLNPGALFRREGN